MPKVIWILLVTAALTVHCFADKPIYITNLSHCHPSTHLSKEREPGKWCLIPYETNDVAGTMVYADSYIEAPDITLPLRQKGWYDIYIAYWHPEFAYDGEPTLKIKLSDESGFRRFFIRGKTDTQHATFLQEIYYKTDDLTGRDLIISKSNGLMAASTSIAYVKLVPLSAKRIEAIKKDRDQREQTKNLVATLDGMSYFHYSQFDRPQDILDLLAPYRDSDVAKVLWAVNYGDTTNYPTQVPGANFIGETGRSRFSKGNPANDYARGELQMYQALKQFAASGTLPQHIAAKQARKMGLKFDLMFRLSIISGAAISLWDENGFVKQNPNLRQVMQDGTPINKASYAFPKVQTFMLDLITESVEMFDVDGINLCFVRAPHFMQFETPIRNAFAKKFNEDIRQVSPDDPRLGDIRALFMTRFMQQVRKRLDDAGKKQGKHFTLSAWVWPKGQNVWLGKTPEREGLDVEAWIKQGLLDSLICQQGISKPYQTLCQQYNCKFILYTGYRGDKAMSPQTVSVAYKQGVDAFASWDTDALQMFARDWNWLRRIGHRREMANWEKHDPTFKTSIQLIKLNGQNVQNALAQEVYSGG